MEIDVTYLKQYFKAFYNLILLFVGVVIVFFVLSYFSKVEETKNFVGHVHENMINVLKADYEQEKKMHVNEYDFFQKFNSVNYEYVDNVIIVKPDGLAFFSSNSDKMYTYGGIKNSGDVVLGDIVLKRNFITTRRFSDNTEVLVLTEMSAIEGLALKNWISQERFLVTITILMPLMTMVFVMLIEDKLLKELRGKFNSFLDLAKSHETAKDELYSGLFYQNRCIMLLIDPKSGAVVTGNESAKTYYGYNFREEYVHISQINTMPETVVYDVMAEAIDKKRNYFNFQHKLKNGMIRDVEVYSGPVVVEGEKLLCSIVHDVTDKIRAEQELLNQKYYMENSLKMKSEVLATISHEIKTPMVGIVQNINEMQERFQEPNLIKALQFLKLNVDSLNRLVFDLIDFSKMETGSFKLYSSPFDLSDVIESSIQLFLPLAKDRNIRLSADMNDFGRSGFIGDSFRISQVVNNLISNSIKYTHDGKIDVVVSDEVHQESSRVKIEVIDTGIGIAPSVVKQIFDRDFTSDETGEHKGTGLGLAICRMIIEAMGGELLVSSEEGVGTSMSFYLTLPLDHRMSVPSIQAHEKSSGEPANKLAMEAVNILVIDDDSISSFYTKSIIERHTPIVANVVTAFNSMEGLRMAALTKFDFIVCDYQLPDQLGTELFSAIRNTDGKSKTAKLVLTSADYVEDKGCSDEFWLKPLDAQTITHYILSDEVTVVDQVDYLERLNHNVFLGWSEWEHMKAYMTQSDTAGVIEVFVRSLEEKKRLLPREWDPISEERIFKVIHAIKGSISYFRSESFLKVVMEAEKSLRSEYPESEKYRIYQSFIQAYNVFLEEAKGLEKLSKNDL